MTHVSRGNSQAPTRTHKGRSMSQDTFAVKPLAAAVAGVVLASAGQVWALPTIPEIEAGAATVAKTDTTMAINQSTQKVVLNFDKFSIAANEAVNFNQPGVDAVALSRVLGGDPSVILGQLTSNGRVFLLNSQGVVFGEGANVDVGGLVAGTLNMSTEDFMAGAYVFSADGATGSVLNQGDINAAEGGFVVLMGAEVVNEGVVTATLGSVALLAGDAVTLDFDGDGLLSYSIDGTALDAAVENRGAIRADGGLVVMAASTAAHLTTTVVNNGGLVQASGMVERDGRIVLTSNATTVNEGELNVASADGAGGSVELDGARTGQFGEVNADGSAGGGSVLIGASDVIDIGAASLTSANATDSGDGGTVIAYTDGETMFRAGGLIQAQGGAEGGDGGFIEVSGRDHVDVRGLADTSAAAGEVGTFLIDPTDIDIVNFSATSGLANTSNNFQSDGSTGSSTLAVADLEANLALGNVIVTTQTGAEALTAPKGGDITLLSAVTSASGNDLSLQAGEDIQLLAAINIGAGTLDLQAGVRTDIDSGSILATNKTTAASVTASADTSIIMVDLSTDTFAGTVNQTGPISITNDKTFAVTADTTAGTGDISVTSSSGSININSINAGSQTVTLDAAAAIDAVADNAGAEITGATLNLSAETGIGAGGNSLDIQNANNVTATTNDGNIDIDAIGGTGTLTFASLVNNGAVTDDIVIDQSGGQAIAITAATTIDGDVTVTSDADVSFGSITAGSAGDTVTITTTGAIEELGADVALDLVATNAALSGTGGVGAAGTIETDVDTFAANGGDIDINNTGALNITTVGTLSNVTSTGNVTIVNDAAVTLTDNIAATGSVTLTASAGTILAAAEDADAEVAGTTVSLNAVNGAVGETGGAGAIDVNASVAVNADTSTANGDIYVDATDDIPLGHLNAGTGMVTVNATVSADGRITDGNAATQNITAATATLNADDAIGVVDTTGNNFFAGVNASGNDALETTVTTFNAVVASAANATINILDSGSPVFTAPVDAGTAAAGSTLLTVDGNVTATTAVDFADAGDSVGIIATSGGTITVPAALNVGQDLLLSGGDIADTNAGDLDSITATRALITSAAAETVTASTIGTADVTSTGGLVALAGETDDLVLDDLDGTGTSISAAAAATVVAAGDVTVNGAIAAAGNAAITATGGVDIQAAITATGGGNINVSADSDNAGASTLRVNGNLTSDATIDLDAGTDANDTIDIDLDITAANGALTVTNAATVDLAGLVDLTGAGVAITTGIGTITLSGADGAAGAVTVTSTGDGNTVNTNAVGSTNNPNLTLSSEGGLTIGNTTNIGTGALSATVDSNDNNAGGETLLVSGSPTAGSITLSGGGTGAGDTIDIDANVNATAGGLVIQNSNLVDIAAGITLTGVSVTATDDVGSINLSGAGTNVVTSTGGDVALNSITDSAAANLTVTSTANVTLADVTLNTGGAGVVAVTADNDNNTAAATLQVGGVVNVTGATTLSGGTDNDDTIDVDADVTTAAALTLQNGNVDLAANVDLTGASVAADNATNSVGSINLSGAGTNVVTSTGGNVNLANVTDSAAANLTVSSTADVTLAQITLDTGGAGVLAVSADDDDNTGAATLQVAGDINVSGTATFAGGTDNNDAMDVDADVTAGGALTMQNGNVDLAGLVDLAGAGVSITTAIGGINLSGADGAAGAVTITSTGDANTITTAAVTATNNPNLTLTSDGGLTIGAATNIGTGALAATVDADGDTGETLLVTGSPTAGAITLSGGAAGTGDTIDIDAAVNATAGALTIRDAALVDVAANINLTGQSVSIVSAIGAIDLSGAGTNIITSTAGDVTLGPVTDSANADLTVSSERNVTLSTITLDNGGSGNLMVSADDDDDDAAAILQVNGTIVVDGTAAFAGGTDNNDTTDVNADVTSSGALSMINGAVDLAGLVDLQGDGVAITTNVTGINLSGADGTAGAVTITSTGDGNTITTAAVTATNNPNLTLTSQGQLTIGASLNIGAGALSATADSNDNGANTLLVSGPPTAGTITLSGGGTGTTDTIDIDANVNATSGALTLKDAATADIAANVSLTGLSVAATDDVGVINLSGAGTNTVTSTGGDVGLNAITDSADANLTVSSTGNVTLATVTLDNGGAGVLMVTADDDDNTAGATLLAGGIINVTGAATLAGGGDNNEVLDIDADVTAGGALTLSGGAVDLAANVDLTGASVAADTATNNISAINLSGAGTNVVTGNTGAVSIADVTDSADANLTVSAATDATVASITLDNGGAGVVNISADDDDNSAASTLTTNGAIVADGAVTLAGGTDNDDAMDINADVTSSAALVLQNTSGADLAASVDLTGLSVTATNAVTAINLSGDGTNLVTATGGNVNVNAITDSANANLTISATGDVTLAAITLDNGGAGNLSVTSDTDNTGTSSLNAGAAIAVDGTVLLSGGSDNDETIDVDADVTAGSTLTIQQGNVDLAANADLTGTSVTATSGVGTINLSGAGTNVVTGTAGDVAIAAVTDSADANLTAMATGNVTLAAVTLNNGGAGTLLATADSDNTGTDTLLAAGAITVDAAATLSGGTDNNEMIDIDADVVSGGALTLQRGNADLAATVDLTGASVAADTATNNVGSINLSGAGTNLVTSTGGNVNLANVTDSAAASLTVSSTADVTLAQITLDAGGAGVLAVTADDDDNTAAATLQVAGDINVTSTATFSGGTDNDENIDVDADITAGGALTMQNANVDLAGGVDLTGAGVSITTNVANINLSGADATLVTITSTGDANTITTAAITSTNNPNLTMSSEGSLNLGAALNIGTGTLMATVDTDNDTGDTLLVTGSPTAGTITLSGGGTGTGDLIDIDADVTATAGTLTIRAAATVDLAANVDLTGTAVMANDSVGVINLSGAGTNLVTSTNGDVALAAITDSANADLTISSEANVTLSTITLDNGGAGNLMVTADDDDDTAAATLQVAGDVAVDGTATFAGGTDNDDNIDVDADITAGGALTMQNGNVDLAGGVDLTGAGVAMNTNIGAINLSGADATLVTITSTGDANTITTAAITSTNNPNLTMTSEGGLTLGAALNIGTGTLTAGVDSNDNNAAGETLLVSGSPTAGTITLQGAGTGAGDLIDIDANVTATTGALTLRDAAAVDVAANVALAGASVTATDDVGGINLSGAGTNTVTATAGDVALNAITDSADANLTVSSTGNVTLATVTLDNGGAGTLMVTADDDDNTAGATLAATAGITVSGAATLAGGTDNNDTIDIDADVVAGGALTLANGNVDLAADVDLTGASVAADNATNSVGSINLSGAGTNIVTGTTGAVSIADVTDSAAANLTVSAATDATVMAITLDAGGAGVVNISADDDDNTAASTLTVNGAIAADGAVTLAGGTDNDDLMDINADVTSAAALVLQNTAGADLAANVDLTGLSVTATNAVTGLNLSGAGTNLITATGDSVAIAAVSDSADANLTIAATDNVTLAAITLDNGGAGNLSVTADSDNTGTSTLAAAGVITVSGTALLSGGTDNDETIDVDANVTAGGALTVQQGNVDLAANVGLTGASVTATSGVGTINLSGAGTNTITATAGDTAIAAVTDSADANLTVAATGNVTLAAVTLDNGGAGTLSVTADTDNTGTSTLLAAGAITVDAAATLSGGTDNDETIDIDADVVAGGALTLQQGNVDLAADVDLTGASVAADNATNSVGSINLSGAGTNIVTSTTGAVNIADMTDSADANLTVSAATNATVAAITLDNGAAGVVNVTADDDDNTAAATLQVGGVINATGAVTLAGGTDNDDTIDVNANVTSAAALTLQNAASADLGMLVDLTGASVTATTALANLNLSGAGINRITGTGGNVALTDITDSADANLLVRATGDVTLATITFDNGGAGALTVSADTDNTGSDTMLAAGAITVDGLASFQGGTDNDDTLDFDADVVAGGALTLLQGNADLAANVNLTGLSVTATAGIGTINLSGAGTNIITSTGGDTSVGAITDSAAANLTISSEANVTTSSITLDTGGAGVVMITADDDDDHAAATLNIAGDVNATGAVTLSGGNDNDELLDIDNDVTSGGVLTLQNGNADLAANVDLTGTVVAAAAGNNLSAINLSGAGDNVITSTAGAVNVTAVTDSAAANLRLSATTDVTMSTVTLDAGGAGNLTATADDDDNTAASTLTVGGVVAVTGNVALSGGTDTDDVIDVNANITAAGTATLTSAATVNLADVTVEAQGGDLTVNPTGIVLDGGTGATLQATTATDNDVILTAVNSAANESLTLSAQGTVDFQGAVNLAGGDLVANADTNNDGTETLAIDQTIAADDVDLNAGGAGSTTNITQTAVITATTLDAVATNGIALTAQNVVPTVTLMNTNAGNVAYNSDLATSAANTLTVSGTNTVSAGTFTVMETTDGMTVAAPTGIATNAGTIALTTVAADQLLTLEGAVNSNQTTATGANVTLTADMMDLDGAANNAGTINAGTEGRVTLLSVTAADAIDLGSATDAAANTLELSSNELTGITAEHLIVGNTTTAGITFSADVSATNVADTVHLYSATGAAAGAVDGTAGGITANNLAVTASDHVIMSSGNNVTNLAVNAPGANVTFIEADGLNITEVNDEVNAEAGIRGANITVTVTGADGDITVQRGITSTGFVALTATRNITQEAGIGTVTTSSTAGSDDVTYIANSDNTNAGAIIMQGDSAVETAGTDGADIELRSGTAATAADTSGASDVTIATVDAGEDGDVLVRSWDGSVRDDGRDSSAVTGETIQFRAQGDVGASQSFTVTDTPIDKSGAIEVNVTFLDSITSRAIDGNNQLMANQLTAADPNNLNVDLLLKSNDPTNVNLALRTGMQAGDQKQIFVGVLDGDLSVPTDIDLSDSATPTALNNDLYLYTGTEGHHINIGDAGTPGNGDITLNRVPVVTQGDDSKQALLILQSGGDVTQTNSTVLTAFEVEAEAPNGSVNLFTGTDQLEAEGGEGENVSITNTTPGNSQFTDPLGQPTTTLQEEIITAGSGNITIVNTGSLTIDKAVKTTGTGDISITANSPLYITNQVSSGGDVTLVSTGDADLDGVYIQQSADGTTNGTVQSNSVTDGSITVTSDNKVVLDANAVLSTLAGGANGAITITGDNNNDVSGTGSAEITLAGGARITAAGGAPVTIGTVGGTLTMGDGAALRTAGGAIGVTAGGNVELALLDAGVTSGGDITVTSTTGAISDAGANTNENIVGDAVTLTAPNGIDTDLIAAGAVTANSSGNNGDINIEGKLGGIIVETVNAGTGTVFLDAEVGGISDNNGDGTTNITAGVAHLTAAGTINSDVAIAGAATPAINATVQTAAGVPQDGTVILRSAVDLPVGRIQAVDGTVRLTAGQAITDAVAGINITGGTVSLTAQGGGIATDVDASSQVSADASATADQTITLASTTGDLRLGAITTAGNGTVNLTSTAGITQTSGQVVASVLNVTAPGSVGSATSLINTTVGTLNATNPVGGLYVNETDALVLGDVTSTAGASVVAGGDITGGANLTVTGDANVEGAGVTLGTVTTTGDAELEASGDLNVAAVSGVNVDAQAGAALTATGAVSATGTANLRATGNLTAQNVTATGNTSLSGADVSAADVSGAAVSGTSTGTLTTTGTVTSTAATTLNAGSAMSVAAINAATDANLAAGTTLTATGTVTTGRHADLSANGNLSAQNVAATGNASLAGADVSAADVSGAQVSGTSTGTLTTTGTVTSTAATTFNAGTALSVAAVNAATDANLTSGTTLTATGTLTAGANADLRSGGDLTATTLTITGDALVDSGAAATIGTFAATGDATLTSAGNAAVTTLSGADIRARAGGTLTTGTTTATGLADLEATGDLSSTNLTAATTAAFRSQANATVGTVSATGISADVTGTLGATSLTATAGDVSLASGGTLTNVAATASGDASFTSGADASIGTVMATDVSATTAAALTAGAITAGGIVNLDAVGNVVATTVTATGNVQIESDGNVMLTTLSGANLEVSADGTLTSGTITATGTASLDADGAINSADLTANGNATVETRDALTIGTITAADVRIVSSQNMTSGTITASGMVTAISGAAVDADDIMADGNASVTGVGNVDVATVTGLGVSLSSDAALTSGAVTAGADAQLMAAGSVSSNDITATGGVAIDAGTTLTSGNVTAGADANLTSGDVLTVGIVNATNIGLTSASTLTSNSLTATGNAMVMATGDVNSTTVTAGGAAHLQSDAALTLASVTANSAMLDAGGTLTATTVAATGNASVEGDTDITLGTLTGDNVTVDGGGVLTLTSITGTGNVALVNAGDVAGGDVTAAGDLTIDGEGAVNVGMLDGGSVMLAGAGEVMTGAIQSAAGADIASEGGALTIGSTMATADVALAGATTVSVNDVTTAGNVSITAPDGVIDLNGNDVNITAAGLTVTGAVNSLDTAVADLTLDVTEAFISNTGDLVVSDSNGTGSVAVLTSGTLTVNELNAAGQSVFLRGTAGVMDGNDAAVNVRSERLTVLSDGAIANLDLEVSSLRIDAASARVRNSGTLNLTGAALDTDLDLGTDGLLAVDSIVAGGDVTLAAAGAISDANGEAVNVRAGSLSLHTPGDADLDTRVDTLTLATGDATIFNSSAMTVGGDVDGNLMLENLTTLTVSDLETTGDAHLSTIAGDIVLGALRSREMILVDASGSIFDGNADAVNLTSTLDTVLRAGGTTGRIDQSIEVNVAGDLHLDAAAFDEFGIAANISGRAGSISFPDEIGFVILDRTGLQDGVGPDSRLIGGFNLVESLGAVGSDIRLIETRGRYTTAFQFESIAAEFYSTDNATDEISYGETETEILTVEDILTSPLSSTSFDGWIDNRVRAELSKLKLGGK